jgi:hypothetical protein
VAAGARGGGTTGVGATKGTVLALAVQGAHAPSARTSDVVLVSSMDDELAAGPSPVPNALLVVAVLAEVGAAAAVGERGRGDTGLARGPGAGATAAAAAAAAASGMLRVDRASVKSASLKLALTTAPPTSLSLPLVPSLASSSSLSSSSWGCTVPLPSLRAAVVSADTVAPRIRE